MEFPEDLYYSKEHTWVQVNGEIGTIGITEFAQAELGEIVYVDLPRIGQKFDQDEVFGTIEAVKTVSDLFMPVAGEVIERNDGLLKKPTLINEAAFTEGWIIKVKISDPLELDRLLKQEAYKELVGL